MFSGTLLTAQEWILSRVIHYALTSPNAGASLGTDINAGTNTDTDVHIHDHSINILHPVMELITSNQPLLGLDPIRTIHITCAYMSVMFDNKFQFSATYSKEFGTVLLRCTRHFASGALSARYLSELSKLIFLHMQNSNAITALVTSSQCLLDMISKWLRQILLSGHNTNNICILISLIFSTPIQIAGCNTIERYRNGLLNDVLEYLDDDVLQIIRVAIKLDGCQACAHINGLLEMLITIDVVQIVNRVSLETISNIISLLCEVVRVGVVAQRTESQFQRGSWMDLLAITNASVLLSMMLICLVDSERRDHGLTMLPELMKVTGSSVQELEEFLILQIMRFKACHQAVNALDEDRILMLSVLQNRISMVLSSCASPSRPVKAREAGSSKSFYIERPS